MNDIRKFARMANRIQEALMALKHVRYLDLTRQLASLTGQLQQLTTESRKMGTSIAKGWLSAAQTGCEKVSRLLGEVEYCVPRIRPLAEKPLKETPTLSTLIEELDALEEEFGEIEFDTAKNTLSVITEPITLEDINLGRFKVQLELNKLDHLYYSSPYFVIALEPNPAATNDSVTHPHVSDEKLCEGDGSAAIRAALEEGRVCDFFTLVRSILNTYSADSPYVRLDDWDGSACYDCGRTMSSEDTYYCEHCEHDYCGECSTYCRRCEETVCLGCSGQPFQGGLRPQNCQRQHILFLACGAGSANCIRKPRVHCMKNGNVILERSGRTGGHRVWKIQLAGAMVRKKDTKSYCLST